MRTSRSSSFLPRPLRAPVVCLVVLLLGLQSCSVKVQKRMLVQPREYATLDRKSPFLKAHIKNGDLLVLSDWSVDKAGTEVSGTGQRFNPDRVQADSGSFTLPIDSVALFETNTLHTSGAVTALSMVTGVTAILAVICLASPKTCFGSCPTFYVSDGVNDLLQAEGFSSSVAPSLERRDIDALYRARPASPELRITMKNEALETHVIRYADILVAPRPEGGRIVATSDGQFYQARCLAPPTWAVGDEGDCRWLLTDLDGYERFSLTDSTDLAARETIELLFDSPSAGPTGLVIGSRQSLLTTFLFYQTLAYMGTQAGYWIATLERHPEWKGKIDGGIGEQLGWIEVQVIDSLENWTTVGFTRETGPLATDVRLVPLPAFGHSPARVRLRLTKGHWRIDYVALAELGTRVNPVRIAPSTVLRGGMTDETATQLLRDTLAPLVTMPGDEYTLVYQLPEDPQGSELFLVSKGYYLEWMRQEWLADEDQGKAMRMFVNPSQAMHDLAPEFKKVERDIEAQFWGSRYARP